MVISTNISIVQSCAWSLLIEVQDMFTQKIAVRPLTVLMERVNKRLNEWMNEFWRMNIQEEGSINGVNAQSIRTYVSLLQTTKS